MAVVADHRHTDRLHVGGPWAAPAACGKKRPLARRGAVPVHRPLPQPGRHPLLPALSGVPTSSFLYYEEVRNYEEVRTAPSLQAVTWLLATFLPRFCLNLARPSHQKRWQTQP